MCGIGGVFSQGENADISKVVRTFEGILLHSESRGKDASGVIFRTPRELSFIKVPGRSRDLFRSKEYRSLVEAHYSSQVKGESFGIVGHTRLATNGSISANLSNQPVVISGICCVHNGIITNYKDLFDEIGCVPTTELDSEIIPTYFRQKLAEGYSLASITNEFFEKANGTVSIACLFDDLDCLLLATNNGAIYTANYQGQFIFASQKDIIHKIDPSLEVRRITKSDGAFILSLKAAEIERDNNCSGVGKLPINEITVPSFKAVSYKTSNNLYTADIKESVQAHFDECEVAFSALRRCSLCILPESFPYIEFNSEGVCNYCLNYEAGKLLGEEAFVKSIRDRAQNKSNPKVLVGLSGGRDSCYALHLVRKYFTDVYAFSYDWGVITDLARRNQARMCEQLNVEHIFVAADLGAKRENIKLNVEAWLSKPNLGAVPLFMAGDKHYFYYANKIREEYDIDAVVFGENLLETTFFKYGFCGIPPNFSREKSFHLGISSKMKMLSFYMKEFIGNPSYINQSLIDSFKGFLSFYFISHSYINIYNYLPWHEEDVNSVLLNQYGWEVDPEYSSTWRIGDGTAALYNFIYYSYVGFSELDTFRSNQIRSGQISRSAAISLVEKERAPRPQAIKWYCDHMNLNMTYVVERIIENSRGFRMLNT